MKKLTKHKFEILFTIVGILVLLLGSGYLIFSISKLNNIENNLRLFGSIGLGIIDLILIFLFFKSNRRFSYSNS